MVKDFVLLNWQLVSAFIPECKVLSIMRNVSIMHCWVCLSRGCELCHELVCSRRFRIVSDNDRPTY
jgi:hypothetical protein